MTADRGERVVRGEERLLAMYKVSALPAVYTVTSFLVISICQNQPNWEMVQEIIFSFFQKHLLRVLYVPSFVLDVGGTGETRTRSLLDVHFSEE